MNAIGWLKSKFRKTDQVCEVAGFVELKEGVDYSSIENLFPPILALAHHNIIDQENEISTPAEKIEECYRFAKDAVENLDLLLAKEPKKKLHTGIKINVVNAYATAILAKELIEGKRKKTTAPEWADEMFLLIAKIKKEHPELKDPKYD
jgi:hypothetical protein